VRRRTRFTRWNTGPAQVSRSSRPRRERYTYAEMGEMFNFGAEVGQVEGAEKVKAELAELLDAAGAVDGAVLVVEVEAYLRGVSEAGR
jgi:hypothetical protein